MTDRSNPSDPDLPAAPPGRRAPDRLRARVLGLTSRPARATAVFRTTLASIAAVTVLIMAVVAATQLFGQHRNTAPLDATVTVEPTLSAEPGSILVTPATPAGERTATPRQSVPTPTAVTPATRRTPGTSSTTTGPEPTSNAPTSDDPTPGRPSSSAPTAGATPRPTGQPDQGGVRVYRAMRETSPPNCTSSHCGRIGIELRGFPVGSPVTCTLSADEAPPGTWPPLRITVSDNVHTEVADAHYGFSGTSVTAVCDGVASPPYSWPE